MRRSSEVVVLIILSFFLCTRAMENLFFEDNPGEVEADGGYSPLLDPLDLSGFSDAVRLGMQIITCLPQDPYYDVAASTPQKVLPDVVDYDAPPSPFVLFLQYKAAQDFGLLPSDSPNFCWEEFMMPENRKIAETLLIKYDFERES